MSEETKTTDSLFPGTLQHDDRESWHPFSDFSLPVVQSGFRDNDQVGSSNSATQFQVSQESDGLKRFTETLGNDEKQRLKWYPRGDTKVTYHLVGQDTVDTIVVQTRHPVQTLDLIISHLTTLHDCETKNYIISRRPSRWECRTHKEGFHRRHIHLRRPRFAKARHLPPFQTSCVACRC